MYVYYIQNFLITHNITTGLNNGNGVIGPSNGQLGGYMVNTGNPGRLGLPDQGRGNSMFHEFDTTDGSGQRSALLYTFDGLNQSLCTQYLLCALGYWDTNYGTDANDVLNRLEYAVADWEYKADTSLSGGYKGLRHGQGNQTYDFPGTSDKSGNGHLIYFELWAILLQWHEDHGYTRQLPSSPSFGGIDTTPP